MDVSRKKRRAVRVSAWHKEKPVLLCRWSVTALGRFCYCASPVHVSPLVTLHPTAAASIIVVRLQAPLAFAVAAAVDFAVLDAVGRL